MARVFGIEQWPVAAVKAYLGHSLAPASGEQLTSALGTWEYGWLPGIATVETPAEDVARDHLRLSQAHMEIDPARMDMALINSKGFGGNNATGLVLAPHVAREMLTANAGAAAMKQYAKKNEAVCAAAATYDDAARAGTAKTIYRYGEGVLTGEDLAVTRDAIDVPGGGASIPLVVDNPFAG